MSNKVVPGLAGVPVTQSTISFVDGQKGTLEYRGIRIEELAEQSHFIESAYLLLYDSLPNATQLKAWQQKIWPYRHLHPELIELIGRLPKDGHPMQALAASICALGMSKPDQAAVDAAKDDEVTACLLGAIPTMVAAFHRYRTGNQPVEADDTLDYAGNFLWMLTGKKPDALQSRILDITLILHADHGLNASTFASRVAGSTLTDPYMLLAAAVSTLKGPLHGGANEAVLKQLRDIGKVEKVKSWMEKKLAAKEKVMGLGHRVYKVKDPRAKALEKLVPQLFEQHGHNQLYAIAKELERVANDLLGSKGIYPNVDFFSGLVYDKLGIPTDLFTPIFAMARTPGWLAHWREQMQDNRIYRPAQVYVGKHDASYVPLTDRS